MPGGMKPKRRRVVTKSLDKPASKNEDRIKFGKGLRYSKKIRLSISSVNNGYEVIDDSNNEGYVFTSREDMLELIGSIIPMCGTEADFVDALGDEEDDWDLDDDNESPF